MRTKVRAYRLLYIFFAFFGAFLLINFRPVSFVYDLLTLDLGVRLDARTHGLRFKIMML
jgi:hypothetical protein